MKTGDKHQQYKYFEYLYNKIIIFTNRIKHNCCITNKTFKHRVNSPINRVQGERHNILLVQLVPNCSQSVNCKRLHKHYISISQLVGGVTVLVSNRVPIYDLFKRTKLCSVKSSF